MDASKRAIGNRVRQIRNGRTQREFAEIIGFSHGFVGDIERGRSFPSIPFLTSLAVNCGSNIHWVLTGEGPPARVDRSPVPGDGGRSPARRNSDRGWPKPDMSAPVNNHGEEADFTNLLHSLWGLFREGDPDTRAWMRVQIFRAFPEMIGATPIKSCEAASSDNM